MHPFFLCLGYLLGSGFASFVIGRLLPKAWPKPVGLFRCFPHERQGRIYEKLGIRKWQNRVPDMSRIFSFIMPRKKLTADFRDQLPRMIRETCVAELVHEALCLTGLFCLWLWPGWGGALMALANCLVNTPFVLIQRYNRPRLMRLLGRVQKRRSAELVGM